MAENPNVGFRNSNCGIMIFKKCGGITLKRVMDS